MVGRDRHSIEPLYILGMPRPRAVVSARAVLVSAVAGCDGGAAVRPSLLHSTSGSRKQN
jgi:hypothetical protein